MATAPLLTKHKRARSSLTEKQKLFVDAKMKGKKDKHAAQEAGATNGTLLSRSEVVKAELEKARAEMRDLTKITRLEVIEGFMDGINIARTQADAANVIKGWSEIARVLGLAVPEVHKIELTVNQQRLRSKLEALSDAELLALQEGRILEGQAKVVN